MSETRFQDLFERSPDAILILEDHRFVDCNPAAVRMLRFPDKPALLGHFEHRTHPADISPPRQPDGRDSFEKAEEILAITDQRGSHTFEWLHLCADGAELLVEVQLTVVRREPTRVTHAVWRDISERKRMEAELRRSQRLEAVGRLAGGVAHDFNNLLMVILSQTELLQDELPEGARLRTHLEGIRAAADRAADLTRQLLAFSRGQPMRSEPHDLCELVDRLGALLRRLIGEHIDLRWQRPVDDLTVFADGTQLEQVIVNLVTNARDAMPDGGHLTISLSREALEPENARALRPGTYAALSVRDTGTGMTPAQIERAFDPFFSTKPVGKGTGLGLATVFGIVDSVGGHVSIASTPGQGTTVTVLLPLSDRKAAPRTHDASAPAPARGRGERILLVEDEQGIRQLFEESLSGAGYQVVAARDGEQALELAIAATEPFQLVVTDVVMPRLSGPMLVEQLLARWPDLPVIYMTGYPGEQDLAAAPGPRERAVLRKPFAPVRLHQEVQRVLQRARSPGPPSPNG